MGIGIYRKNASGESRSLIYGCHSVNFSEIKDASSREFEAAMDIYIASFQENERRPRASIIEMLNCERCRLIVGDTGECIVFMALLYPLKGTSFLLGDYLATMECHRNLGIGEAFLRYIFNEMKNMPFDHFLIQIENPHDGDEMKNRRMKFYKRLGMKELTDVRYILPPFQGTKTTDLTLMTNPREDELFLEGEAVRDLVIRMFGELYGRYEGDAFLMRTLESIPKLVRLD
jgi:ribosomal protein S18 acetylase RimI-like enzyme